MTFSTFAMKEGSTKRSKYVKDTCVRLCRFLEIKVREALRTMELCRSPFLNGANWSVVKAQTSGRLEKHTAEMEHEIMQQHDDEMSDEDASEKESKGEVVDARIGIYGILLARVQDSWSRGALSGKVSHIITAILEHGIDEGQVTAEDIAQYLESHRPSCFDRILYSISECLFTWIGYDSCINQFAEIGDCPLLASQRTNLHYVTSRPFEKLVNKESFS
ncbi:hypothetical protein COOONC_12830 [Cooperia oncophora]